MVPTADVDQVGTNATSKMEEDNRDFAWGQRSFVNVVHDNLQESSLYTGEGDKDEKLNDCIEQLCGASTSFDDGTKLKSSIVPISLKKYHSLFQPWKGALLLKLLGKTISLQIVEQRTRNLWNLSQGFELINMEGGYFMAHFYAREEYFHVLEGGLDYYGSLLDFL